MTAWGRRRRDRRRHQGHRQLPGQRPRQRGNIDEQAHLGHAHRAGRHRGEDVTDEESAGDAERAADEAQDERGLQVGGQQPARLVAQRHQRADLRPIGGDHPADVHRDDDEGERQEHQHDGRHEGADTVELRLDVAIGEVALA
jgi:hypothetical protein